MNAELVALIGALILGTSAGWQWLTTRRHHRIERARLEVWQRHCVYTHTARDAVYPLYEHADEAMSWGFHNVMGSALSKVDEAMKQRRDQELEAVTAGEPLATTVTEDHAADDHSCGQPPYYRSREDERRSQRWHLVANVAGGAVAALGAALALMQ